MKGRLGPEISRLTKYIRRHHVGLIAVAISLTGTAYAADLIGPKDIAKNAVLSRHIKNGQIKGPDLGGTSKVTRVFDVVDQGVAGDGNYGAGGGGAICPRNTRAIGFRVGFDSGGDPRGISALDLDERTVSAFGFYNGGGTARLRVIARCLKN